MLQQSSRIFHVLMITAFMTVLGGCVTAQRGSNTYFVVNTLPPGATVTTDKLRSNSKSKQADDLKNTDASNSEFYGCVSTPCEIKMPRRSQFNVMITKDGYQPFFYVVRKKHYKESKKDKELRTAVTLTPNGDLVTTEELSKNAGYVPEEPEEAIPVIAGAAFGAYSAYGFGWTASTVASAPSVVGIGVLAAPIAVLMAEPVLLANSTVDLSSGALLDLTPNPMSVQLAPEPEGHENVSAQLKAAFIQSRNNKTRSSSR